MERFIRLPEDRRRAMCDEAGLVLGLSAGSVEKDFWVCWALRTLFDLPATGPHLTFKGGTSLSKGWKLIQRFSEDIDVVIDRDFLGFGGDRSPEGAPSHKQRARRLDELKTACQQHVRNALLHEESYRADERPRARLARHYYDLWCLLAAGIGDHARADEALFERVTAHRAVFFRKSKEVQDSLRRGGLRLVPSADRRAAWKRDYDAMRESMFFGEPPTFDEILAVVATFEREFNRP